MMRRNNEERIIYFTHMLLTRTRFFFLLFSTFHFWQDFRSNFFFSPIVTDNKFMWHGKTKKNVRKIREKNKIDFSNYKCVDTVGQFALANDNFFSSFPLFD